MYYQTRPSLVQIMACCLANAKPSSDQCWLIADCMIKKKLQWNLNSNTSIFTGENWIKRPSAKWQPFLSHLNWGQVTHICVSKLTIIGSDNGLLPGRHQAIIWTNAGIWNIVNSNFWNSEILSEIHTFSFKKMYLKMLSAKWQPFCPTSVLKGCTLALNHKSPWPCYIHWWLMTFISNFQFIDI